MLGMKENLIDMLGTVFANRQTEALARAKKTLGMKRKTKNTAKPSVSFASLTGKLLLP